MRKKNSAFTLAEVLIALVVIGIIAAITLTTVMPNIQERVNSQRQANIVYKVTQATNLMKANGAMINGFESTDKFVDELQKYLKIMKRCDSDHIDDCWPTKKVRTSNGEEFEVSKAKTRRNLGFKDEYSANKNVGIVLVDGASLILTYNPGAAGIPVGDPITSLTTELPVGGKYQMFLDYTSNVTGGLAFVMDVNGSKGPNSETINNKSYDIRSFNMAQFSVGCIGTILNGKCYLKPNSVTPLDCSRTNGGMYGTGGTLNTPENSPYCGTASAAEEDYYAGSKKACNDKGMIMANLSTLETLCNSRKDFLGIISYIYWASDSYNQSIADSLELRKCTKYNYAYRNTSTYKVLCIDE